MHKQHKFETCSDSEMYEELMKYSRARFHATKKRFENESEILSRMDAIYKHVKAAHLENRRHTKYKKETRAGKIWRGILARTSKKSFEKYPTYRGCKISDNFKDVDFFYEWCHRQRGFLEKDDNGLYFEIDKDILGKTHDKIYSEDVCVFVPKEINAMTKFGESLRGDLPIGVAQNVCSGRFIAQFGKKSHGTFNTAEEASLAYKQKKEEHARFLAEKWKDKIDIRVYDFLVDYRVDGWI